MKEHQAHTHGEARVIIDNAKQIQAHWYNTMVHADSKSSRTEAFRNWNAMRGVVKALQWAYFGGESPLN
jgi:hypothetical protein